MGTKTKIEWTDATWNPFMGCSRVSEGCRHCYAERIAGRFGGQLVKSKVYGELTQIVNGVPVWSGVLKQTSVDARTAPLHWRKPRRVFVNSMSDLFHENAPDEWIDDAFAVMALCPQHKFQILTKRPERMLTYILQAQPQVWDAITRIPRRTVNRIGGKPLFTWPLPNVWLGVSVEHQKAADERIPLLLRTPATVRFISAEPLLGPLDLQWAVSRNRLEIGAGFLRRGMFAPGLETIRPLDWVICGGESGPGARVMSPSWARSLRDQCVSAGVPFFFKQWGEFAPGPHPTDPSKEIPIHCSMGGLMHHAGKKAAGSLLDGREWKEFPCPR
jgi:protein gp37